MRTRARDPVEMDRLGQYGKNAGGDRARDRVCDQSYIKQFNIQSVLAMLKQRQPVSRTEIARMTGMSPTSITRIIGALISQELVYETAGEQRPGRGRKATNLAVNSDGLYAIGIHLENSVIRLCVMNFSSEVLYRGETLIDGACVPEQMAQTAKALFDRMPKTVVEDFSKIGAVGVCLSGAVEPGRGTVTQSYQMAWEDVDLQAAFSEAFGMPACIENDAKACLIGEKVRMGIPDSVDTAYLLVDKGIGLACSSGGVLLRGERNEAGEISRIPIGLDEEGRPESFSDHLNVASLIRRARAYDSGIHSLEGIVWAERQGAEWARALIDDFRKYLEIMIGVIDGVCNPSRIILGGSVCPKLWPEVEKCRSKAQVYLGDRYEESCMTGAALVAIRRAVVEMIGQSIE